MHANAFCIGKLEQILMHWRRSRGGQGGHLPSSKSMKGGMEDGHNRLCAAFVLVMFTSKFDLHSWWSSPATCAGGVFPIGHLAH